MSSGGSVTRLIQLIRSEDAAERQAAARLIWQRYFHDLLELARRNLDRRVRPRADEEDVVQSMFRSFCLRQERGAYHLAGRDELWKLLVTITLTKARNTARYHRREKRDVAREQPATWAGGDSDCPIWASRKWTRPIRRRRKPPCSTRRWNDASRPWATPSCGKLLSGVSKATPTAKSPIAWIAPSGRLNEGWSEFGRFGRVVKRHREARVLKGWRSSPRALTSTSPPSFPPPLRRGGRGGGSQAGDQDSPVLEYGDL